MDQSTRRPSAAELAAQAAEKAAEAVEQGKVLTIRMNLADQRFERLERRTLKEQDAMTVVLARIEADVAKVTAFQEKEQAEREARKREVDARAAAMNRRLGILLPVCSGGLLAALGVFTQNMQAHPALLPVGGIILVACLVFLVAALYQAGKGRPGGTNPGN